MKTNYYYQECLRIELDKRIKINPRYSLRSFARALNVSPGTLCRVLKGEKRLSLEKSRHIAEVLELGPKDTKAFLSSIAESYENADLKRIKADVRAVLKQGKETNRAERDLTPEIFRIISDWYHYGILQLAETGTCKSDPSWIARQLGVNELEIKFALERLIELEMLRVEEGILQRTTEKLTAGDPTLTTSAHRKRIKQVTEKSLHSLDNDPLALRNHTTMTMAIDPEQLPLAKEMIDEFMDHLSLVLQIKKKKVYELQINLFPLQRSTL